MHYCLCVRGSTYVFIYTWRLCAARAIPGLFTVFIVGRSGGWCHILRHINLNMYYDPVAFMLTRFQDSKIDQCIYLAKKVRHSEGVKCVCSRCHAHLHVSTYLPNCMSRVNNIIIS